MADDVVRRSSNLRPVGELLADYVDDLRGRVVASERSEDQCDSERSERSHPREQTFAPGDGSLPFVADFRDRVNGG